MKNYLYHWFVVSGETRANGVLHVSELISTAESFRAATAEIAVQLGLAEDACVMLHSLTLLNPDVSA